MFERIVVGLDGSEHSEHALKTACGLAEKYNSEICLCHTPQPDTVAFALGAVPGYHVATTMPSEAEVREAAEKIVDKGKELAGQLGQTVTKTHIKRGKPASEITDFAESCGADLIVTGRRGLGSARALMQGSTSQEIGHLAKCACLTVV